MSLIERALEKHRRQNDRPPPTAVPAQAAAPPAAPEPAPAMDADARNFPHRAEILAIDTNALRRMGYLPMEEAVPEMTHQYRRLKRPLVVNALKRDLAVSPRIIAVGSAIAGEGKSFTSLNLSLSLAIERDFSVLLIDGDVSRHALTTALECTGEPGLLDLIEDGPRLLENAIRATDHQGLYFLPSGAWRDNAPELLGSQRLARLLSEISTRFPSCLVVCDTPPTLLTNEARSFLSLAGQVVFVVGAGSTPRQSVLDSLAMIEPDRPVSMVLNKYTGPVNSGYLYYGDHYKTRAPVTDRANDSEP